MLNEVSMNKTYNYENCTVNVYVPDDENFQERLRKASENFMRKVMNERNNDNGNCNSSKDFRKK